MNTIRVIKENKVKLWNEGLYRVIVQDFSLVLSEAAARDLRDQLDAELGPTWISVSDRLPPDNNWVLVQYRLHPQQRRPDVTMAQYDERRGWRDRGGHTFEGELTHWMPVPEPEASDG